MRFVTPFPAFRSSWLAGLVALALLPAVAGAAEAVPPPPANLTAKSGGNSEIPLTWEASAGATSYAIYASTTQNDTNARKIPVAVSEPHFKVTHLKNDTTYYFRVKALNAAGESGFSGEASATTQVTGQPLPDGVYTLAPKHAPQLRLQAAGGRVEVAGRAKGSTAQHWKLVSVDGAVYQLAPVDQPAALLGAGSADANAVVQLGAAGTPPPQWKLAPDKGGYRLLAMAGKDLALGAAGATAGAGVVQGAADGSSAQIWNILPLPVGGPDGWPDPGTKFVPAGYQLVFGDEFDGSAIDLVKWETLAPYSQPHLNDEIECYEPEAVILQDGMCILRAEEAQTRCGGKHTWRSGSITSRAAWTHGYYEARFRIPQGQGLWPAFWVTSSKRWPPEWDIVEIPNTVGTLYQYMHPTRGSRTTWVEGAEGSDSIYTIAEGMPNPYDGFVVYGCEVTAKGVTMWVNGRLTAKWEVSGDTTDPMWVNCELAVGGKWPGPPDATTPQPADMVIDYVRVYQLPDVKPSVPPLAK